MRLNRVAYVCEKVVSCRLFWFWEDDEVGSGFFERYFIVETYTINSGDNAGIRRCDVRKFETIMVHRYALALRKLEKDITYYNM